jgi:hypothetical protein
MSNRYPQLGLRSKNEIAKRICSKKLSQNEALELINDVIKNFDDYWKDSKESEPRKQKYIRSAAGNPLNKLLKAIDAKILQPHDHLVPNFIFGGLKGTSHIDAAYSLIGRQNARTILKMDIKRFYKQITRERVFFLFYRKCGCSVKAANLLADLCCVPVGKKGSGSTKKTIARGFPTSSRLAIWTNLDTFLRLQWEVSRLLRKHDPKVVVFVDDIGVSASRVSGKLFKHVKHVAQTILAAYDENQPLPVNKRKTQVIPFSDGAEHLGLLLGRNKISIGRKTKSKMARVKNKIASAVGLERKSLLKKRSSYYSYKKQIKKAYDN